MRFGIHLAIISSQQDRQIFSCFNSSKRSSSAKYCSEGLGGGMIGPITYPPLKWSEIAKVSQLLQKERVLKIIVPAEWLQNAQYPQETQWINLGLENIDEHFQSQTS